MRVDKKDKMIHWDEERDGKKGEEIFFERKKGMYIISVFLEVPLGRVF